MADGNDLLIRLIINEGAGETLRLDIEDGTTLTELLEEYVTGYSEEKYVATVNGVEKENGYELRNGDSVSVVPKKFKGMS